MAIITLLTDFGDEDHYVAAVKGKILSSTPDVRLIDISHQNPLSNISAAAYTIKSAYTNFPEDTVHIISIQQQNIHHNERIIAARLNHHYFVLPDNGLLSLIDDNPPEEVVTVDITHVSSIFLARDIMAPVAAQIAGGKALKELGKPAGEIIRLLNRNSRATLKQISGHVINVDYYGNLITNVKKEDFDIISSKATGYTIIFGRERSQRVHLRYNAVEAGEIFLIFNSQDLLEIGINQGNAEQLLGLSLDNPVVINFESS